MAVFLILEYLMERKVEAAASGLVFPLGFLLFWAFYFVFLRDHGGWRELLLLVPGQRTRAATSGAIPLPPPRDHASDSRGAAAEPELPSELKVALSVLGLAGKPDWDTIHRRYRKLAKAYHPDLNSEFTAYGNRFIELDHAYRKLVAGRSHFA